MARFPIGRIYDPNFPGERLSAIVDAHTFGCAITVEALVAHYGAEQRRSEQILPHRVVVIHSADC
jgi:Protein of unknown function (DUF1488)